MLNRRQLILSAPIALAGCTTSKFFEEMGDINVDKKTHAARRNEWKGDEMVFAVVHLGGGFVMVRHRSPLGWSFPGGIVDPERHGLKTPVSADLVTAVTGYAHSQATLPIQVSKTALFAYGYAIDDLADRMLMVHYFQIGLPTSFPPTVTANFTDVTDAKWVAVDDARLSKCLVKRISEYETIGEGGTIILEGCA
jgi:hypothetical protein